MGRSLDKLSISGFKSINVLKDFDLKKLNLNITHFESPERLPASPADSPGRVASRERG